MFGKPKCESHCLQFYLEFFFFQICHQLVMSFLGSYDVLMLLNLGRAICRLWSTDGSLYDWKVFEKWLTSYSRKGTQH